ncbi:MAG: redox-regulated ATPase YchF [Spirochaetaceae bacterium]|jgi:GTP-binding protein YchF|nr:redox-regulated ATPase YchF [Spirochaetaceae bacterium]
MALNCGIVGLPNVGKSTIFSALSSAPAEAANYPFCTINPNIGIVNVPDGRLSALATIFQPARVIPAAVEFVDIAGLVKGASHGEGMGNQFLSHIREAGMIAHVVRCFENPDVIHVDNRVDPASDIETVNIELALADLQTLEKRQERAERALKVQAAPEKKAAETVLAALAKIGAALEDGRPARSSALSADELAAVYDCHLITLKPQVYICNTDEAGVKAAAAGMPDERVLAVKSRAEAEGSEAVVICGKFEAELAGIEDEAEKAAFLEELGLRETGLTSLVRACYRLLGLATFFTAGNDECLAWTIHAVDAALRASGVIQSDFEKGFIKAEVYGFDDIVKYGTEAKIKEAGKYRVEGRDYIVRDGDVMFFKFNL